jgi:hypothetical protein
MGAWGMTAWANDSALDWRGMVTDKVADAIESEIVSGERHTLLAAGDLLNQLTPYTTKVLNGRRQPVPGKGVMGIQYTAEHKKMFSRMIAQLECLRADVDWLEDWSDGGKGVRAEATRIINALRRKVKHEQP